MNFVRKSKTLSKVLNKNKLSSHVHVVESFHGRISALIDMYYDSSASKKSLQKFVTIEVERIKLINGDILPDIIIELLDKNGLKY
jgi:hypothetical protein